MLAKVRTLIADHKDIIIYLVFGVLTTAVSYGIYFPLYNSLSWSATLCNVLSWIGAVIFAFATNKTFVFSSYDWHFGVVLPELAKFVVSRLASLVMETAIIFVTVELLYLDGNIMKVIASVVVVIMNYITSKLIVFKMK